MQEDIKYSVRKTSRVISVALLVPWAPLATVSGMAFDGWPDHKASIIALVTIMWSYPFMVFIGFVASFWFPWLSILPLFNVLAFLICCLFGL